MKILAFEWLTGGGACDQHPFRDGLKEFHRQGHAMLSTICADFLAAGHRLIVPVDHNLGFECGKQNVEQVEIRNRDNLRPCLEQLAGEADAVLLIVPESDSCLEDVCQWMTPWRNKLISPGLELIRLTSNKWVCHQHFVANEIPSPKTILIDDSVPFDQEAFDSIYGGLVIKPVDGAGSENISFYNDKSMIDSTIEKGMILQEFVTGKHVSVSAILHEANEPDLFDAMEQVFGLSQSKRPTQSPIGPFSNATLIKDECVQARARKLAVETIASLPNSQGHIGIDMVISNESRAFDYVIEINPRLTSSYVFRADTVRRKLVTTMLQDLDRM